MRGGGARVTPENTGALGGCLHRLCQDPPLILIHSYTDGFEFSAELDVSVMCAIRKNNNKVHQSPFHVKSVHSAAIFPMPLGSYFRQTRLAKYRNLKSHVDFFFFFLAIKSQYNLHHKFCISFSNSFNKCILQVGPTNMQHTLSGDCNFYWQLE